MLFPVAFLCLRQLQLMYIPTSRGTDFFYPYVTQILKQKYIFKDLFITHDLGNLQRFVKFLFNSQKYQIPNFTWKHQKLQFCVTLLIENKYQNNIVYNHSSSSGQATLLPKGSYFLWYASRITAGISRNLLRSRSWCELVSNFCVW